jgi:RNA polymerase sigma-70 factor (ECF subfamily)
MTASNTGSRASAGGSTSRSLLANAQHDDPAAWERLVRLYAPLVASWCRRQGVAEQDVVDVLQEVFAAVAGHLEHFQKRGPADTFRGWLATIARNKVRDHFRRRRSEPAAAGGTEATFRFQQIAALQAAADGPGFLDAPVFGRVLGQALDTIRGEFQEQTWMAFWSVVIEGRATPDVAADLGMQPGTVRVAKSRVLRRLRHELGDFS